MSEAIIGVLGALVALLAEVVRRLFGRVADLERAHEACERERSTLRGLLKREVASTLADAVTESIRPATGQHRLDEKTKEMIGEKTKKERR